jgi:hypothetical protein
MIPPYVLTQARTGIVFSVALFERTWMISVTASILKRLSTYSGLVVRPYVIAEARELIVSSIAVFERTAMSTARRFERTHVGFMVPL